MKPAGCSANRLHSLLQYYLLRLIRPENGLRFFPMVDLRLLLEILPKLFNLGLETFPLWEAEFHL